MNVYKSEEIHSVFPVHLSGSIKMSKIFDGELTLKKDIDPDDNAFVYEHL